MVADAKKFKDANEAVRKKIEAKNALEVHCFSVRNSFNQKQFVSALKPGDKDLIEKAIKDCLAWIESNRDAGVMAFETGA
jgi:molecular chaperone DnaK (HSP70)